MIIIGKLINADSVLRTVMVLKASKPLKTPIWAPFKALKNKDIVPIHNAVVSPLAVNVFTASQGENR